MWMMHHTLKRATFVIHATFNDRFACSTTCFFQTFFATLKRLFVACSNDAHACHADNTWTWR
ncbi:hypothetical protein RISK_001953 [Rhodopirellula islandica]|uniref:Uncharacterized protein n=1 Tax=Rhodopirellula islandica TaxID=595434 RepID=A0A0J1BHV2_RHOIS|nr:hypothetical protein RISK_001953 [Rhodopirellula islandica]